MHTTWRKPCPIDVDQCLAFVRQLTYNRTLSEVGSRSLSVSGLPTIRLTEPSKADSCLTLSRAVREVGQSRPARIHSVQYDACDLRDPIFRPDELSDRHAPILGEGSCALNLSADLCWASLVVAKRPHWIDLGCAVSWNIAGAESNRQ